MKKLLRAGFVSAVQMCLLLGNLSFYALKGNAQAAPLQDALPAFSSASAAPAFPVNPDSATIFKQPVRGFFSNAPAENWEHALLSGNGEMGAMVMGQPYDETIILSHAALYLPQRRSGKKFDQQASLPEIRQLLAGGHYREAAAVPAALREKLGFYDERDPFIPAFDLRIIQVKGGLKQYQRSVNFETGEARVSWLDDKGRYDRKVFVSRTDSLIVLSIKSSTKINCVLNFEPRFATVEQSGFIDSGVKVMDDYVDGNYLIFKSEFNNKYSGSLTGYAGAGRLILGRGTSEVKAGKLVIADADEVLLMIRIKPSYGDPDALVSQLKSELSQIERPDYAALLKRHAVVHGELFRRVKLELNGSPEARKLSNESLILSGDAAVNTALIERVFDAGRYNILSATGVLPPNLQGLWSGTWTTPWSAGFTTDGNLPTAISILLPGSMPELMKGFFDYHEKMLPAYRNEALSLFGTRGIHVPAQLTTRGEETDFGPLWCLTFWSGAAGWTANSFHDYYLYTGDRVFLKEHAYPFMKEAVLFYEDFLQEDSKGKLLFIPSYSPENNPAGSGAQAAVNAVMDVMIAKQLLRNCISSAKVLHMDTGKVALWERMLLKMPVYEVNEEGALKEWLWPGLKDNYSHRHVSQLYGLFDGVDPDFAADSSLMAAARVLIGKKMDFRRAEGGGEMAFGLVQLGTAAVHAGDPLAAEQLLNWLATKYWTNGMGSFHNVKGLFNTDISGGLPYLVTQMLCQSEPGFVELLPALPQSWAKGKVKGLSLKGQLTVDLLEWKEGSVVLKIRSGIDQRVRIKYRNLVRDIVLKKGREKRVDF